MQDQFTLKTLPLAWMAIPLEIRALSIAFFYACGTLLGGVAGPALFGYLVGTGSRALLSWCYAAGAVLMIAGGVTEALIGVDAERKPLEQIAQPLSWSK